MKILGKTRRFRGRPHFLISAAAIVAVAAVGFGVYASTAKPSSKPKTTLVAQSSPSLSPTPNSTSPTAAPNPSPASAAKPTPATVTTPKPTVKPSSGASPVASKALRIGSVYANVTFNCYGGYMYAQISTATVYAADARHDAGTFNWHFEANWSGAPASYTTTVTMPAGQYAYQLKPFSEPGFLFTSPVAMYNDTTSASLKIVVTAPNYVSSNVATISRAQYDACR